MCMFDIQCPLVGQNRFINSSIGGEILMRGVYLLLLSSIEFCKPCCASDWMADVIVLSTHCSSSICGVIVPNDGGCSEGGLSLVTMTTGFMLFTICPYHSLLLKLVSLL